MNKMLAMSLREQSVEAEVSDPLLVAKRNRDLMRVTAAIVALSIIVVWAAFCISQPLPLPSYLP
jgi:hypothetical protein